MAMPPEKREQVLERLPPQQQANLRQRLDRYDKLPAAERARLNQVWSTFNSLPEARREDLKPVLQRLRRMPEARRDALLNSQEFKEKFSASEWQMLAEISQNYPLPGR